MNEFAPQAVSYDVPRHWDRSGGWTDARTVIVTRLNYVALWRRDGARGQLDGLWSAACYQLRAEQVERLFDTMFDLGASDAHLSSLVDAIETEWNEAHESFNAERPKHLRVLERVRPHAS
jgi:hypothetical protein